MGDRINYGLVSESGDVLFLYSHWGASSWITDLQKALGYASGRLDDTSYATRIVMSQLVGEGWRGETGYGLSINKILDSDVDFVPVIDFKTKTVEIYKLDWVWGVIEETIVSFPIDFFIEQEPRKLDELIAEIRNGEHNL